MAYVPVNMVLIGLLIVSFSYPSHAAPYDLNAGTAVQVPVMVEVKDLGDIEPDLCVTDPDASGCEQVVITSGQPKHFCEDNPDAIGCRYYKGED